MNNLETNNLNTYIQIIVIVADYLGCSADYLLKRRQNSLDFREEMQNLLDALSDEKLMELCNYMESIDKESIIDKKSLL